MRMQNKRNDLHHKFKKNGNIFMDDFETSKENKIQSKLDAFFVKSIMVPYLNDVFIGIFKNQ